MLDVCAKPELVSWAHVAPDRRGAAAVDEAHHSFAIHRERNGLAEFQIAEPWLLGCNVSVLGCVERVHVQQKKDELETRADVVEALAFRRIFFLKQIETICADSLEDLRF